MRHTSWMRPAWRLGATTFGVAAGAYAAYAAATWSRYGHVRDGDDEQADQLLDRFMPTYEVVERHAIHVDAPPAVTFGAACDQDLWQVPLIRAVFRAREMALGAASRARTQPGGLLAFTQSLGWGVLAEVPDREVVVGAVTKPWEPEVTFHALPPAQFAAFAEPDFVKIVWTLRVDPADEGGSIFRTETRAVATDATARARFRRYWSLVSPGIALIRRLSLRPLKREAERRARVEAEIGPAWSGAGEATVPTAPCSPARDISGAP